MALDGMKYYELLSRIEELRNLAAFGNQIPEHVFKEMAENMDEVFWVRTDDQMIYINPAFEKLWGIPCSAIYENPQIFTESIHPDDRENVLKIFNSATFKKTGYIEYEYRIVRSDQQVCWVHAKSLPVLNDKGETIRRIGIARDITSQKTLQEQSSLLAGMIDIAPSSITIHDESGNFLYANQKTFEIHGYIPEEFMMLNLHQLDVPESASLIEERINMIREQGHATFEVEHYRKDGSKFPLEVFVKQVDWMGKKAFLSTATDISERKRAEIEKKESEEKFKLLVAMLGEGVGIVNLDNQFIFANAAAERIFETEPNELTGKSLFEFLSESSKKLVVEETHKRISGESSIYDLEIQTLKGEIKNIIVTATPYYSDNQVFIGTLGVFRDITDRIKAEKALKESEEKFRTFVENANDIIYQVNPDGFFTYVSPNWIEILGYPLNETIGKNIETFIHPDDYPRYLDFLNVILTTGEKQSGIEYRVKHKNGSWHWHVSSGSPLKDGEGNIISYLGIAHDVTEKKEMERKALELSQRYQTIIQNFPNGAVFLFDKNLKYIHVEGSALHEVGLEPGKMIGKTIKEVFPQEVFEIASPELQLLFEGKTCYYEVEFAGRIFANWGEPVISHNNKIEEGLVFAVDITAQKIYEQQIIFQNKEYESLNEELRKTNEELFVAKQKAEESEYKVRNMFENTQIGIVFCNTKGEILEANPAILDILGSPSLEASKKINLLTFEPLLEIGFAQNVAKCIETKRKITEDKVYTSKWGKVVFIKYHLVPVIINNKVVGVWVNLNNLTDLWQIQKELIKAKEKAEENDRLKTAFLQNMSHEIRTPMNAIMGFSELLQHNIDNKDKIRNFVSIINQRSNDLLVIINDILDIAKIESGQLQLIKENVNIVSLLKELKIVFEQQQTKLNKSNINISVKIPEGTTELTIKTDKSQLVQIFNNLLGNALKFTFQGQVEYGFEVVNESNIIFFVSDTGLGIPLDKQEIIFERFYRIAQRTDILIGGNGLGLAITKGLVQLMGGKIWVNSELEQGSTFYFTLDTNIETLNKQYFNNAIDLSSPHF